MKNFTNTVSTYSTQDVRPNKGADYYAQKADEYAEDKNLTPAQRLLREQNARQSNVSNQYVQMDTNNNFA